MDGTLSRPSLLEKLRENEARNSARFRAAGYLASTKSVRCPKCGLYEAIVFWTPLEGTTNATRYQCPRGCRTTLHYDPAEETTEENPTRFRFAAIARWIVLSIMVYFAVDYFAATSRGQLLAAQLWASSQAHFSEFVVAIGEISGLADAEEVPVAESAR
jgi:hypothetical protein